MNVWMHEEQQHTRQINGRYIFITVKQMNGWTSKRMIEGMNERINGKLKNEWINDWMN